MGEKAEALRSDIAWSLPDRIVVRGLNLADDLLGNVNFGDMAFLQLMGRLPHAGESVVFNAVLVALVEHGITPSALATRLTYLGAPESLQGSVAAGLLGAGSRFLGTIEGAARILQEVVHAHSSGNLSKAAAAIVADHRDHHVPIPGLGHPVHRPVDPRTVRLFALADEHGLSGDHVRLMRLLEEEAERVHGLALPINATGAIGALASEMGIPWQICRGLGVMARAVGLVGHVLEEMNRPMAREIWRRVEEEATVNLRPDAG